ncbi:MAG: hypothetical protein V1647_00145 [Pseudomonadota bacterium]
MKYRSFYKREGWSFFVPLFVFIISSCTTGDTTKADRGIAMRAVQAAKDAEFSKCKSAAQGYFEAGQNLQIGERYFLDENNWDQAKVYFKQATALAEKAEEENALCEAK